ncbi:hypothetical protein [Roseinatronobacter domitianus]|uniref:hypothetical protein n=1 Tax=Roseinatronobacter domitianus TaxID=2940293 RepID=UPI003D16C0C0
MAYLHELIGKPDVSEFRCNLTGGRSNRSLKPPVWMFDRVVSAICRAVDTAHVGLDTLTALPELLREAQSIDRVTLGASGTARTSGFSRMRSVRHWT